MDQPLELRDCALDEPEEELVVEYVFADHLAAITAIEDMVEGALDVHAGWTCHLSRR